MMGVVELLARTHPLENFSRYREAEHHCALCVEEETPRLRVAVVHGRTRPRWGPAKDDNAPWTYMCEDCFVHYGVGLGGNRGQALLKETL